MWAGPIAVFVLWELVCYGAFGSVPIADDTGNTGLPFAALLRLVSSLLSHPGRYLLDLAMFGVIGVVVVGALIAMKRSRATGVERIAFVIALALAVSLSRNVWNPDPDELRTVSDLWLLASGVILSARASWARWAIPVLIVATGLVWVDAARTLVIAA